MRLMQETILNGLVVGSVYALISSGLTLIYGVMRVINVAHADFMMVGGYIVIFLLATTQVPLLAAVAISIVLMAALGVLADLTLVRPFRRRNQSEEELLLSTVVVTLGASFVLSNAVFAYMGADVRSLPPLVGGRLEVLGVPLSGQQVLVVAVSTACVLGLRFMLARTRLGLALRAVSQNPEAAQVVGVNRDLTYAAAFAIAAVLAGLGGILIAPIYYLYPFMGLNWIIKSLIIVVVGGLGNLTGAIIVSFGLAIVESFLGSYIGFHAGTIGGLVAVVLALTFRPEGVLRKTGAGL
jgi:branched-chain amino acid transport system permease protein